MELKSKSRNSCHFQASHFCSFVLVSVGCVTGHEVNQQMYVCFNCQQFEAHSSLLMSEDHMSSQNVFSQVRFLKLPVKSPLYLNFPKYFSKRRHDNRDTSFQGTSRLGGQRVFIFSVS